MAFPGPEFTLRLFSFLPGPAPVCVLASTETKVIQARPPRRARRSPATTAQPHQAGNLHCGRRPGVPQRRRIHPSQKKRRCDWRRVAGRTEAYSGRSPPARERTANTAEPPREDREPDRSSSASLRSPAMCFRSEDAADGFSRSTPLNGRGRTDLAPKYAPPWAIRPQPGCPPRRDGQGRRGAFIKLDEMWQAFRPNEQILSHRGRYSEASSVMLWIMSQL